MELPDTGSSRKEIILSFNKLRWGPQLREGGRGDLGSCFSGSQGWFLSIPFSFCIFPVFAPGPRLCQGTAQPWIQAVFLELTQRHTCTGHPLLTGSPAQPLKLLAPQVLESGVCVVAGEGRMWGSILPLWGSPSCTPNTLSRGTLVNGPGVSLLPGMGLESLAGFEGQSKDRGSKRPQGPLLWPTRHELPTGQPGFYGSRERDSPPPVPGIFFPLCRQRQKDGGCGAAWLGGLSLSCSPHHPPPP